MSAHNYRTITDAATATRDLAELVELGALERVGSGAMRAIIRGLRAATAGCDSRWPRHPSDSWDRWP
ncbi:hypothetical protein ACFSLT_04735 [Novosphingobium resinovorum]